MIAAALAAVAAALALPSAHAQSNRAAPLGLVAQSDQGNPTGQAVESVRPAADAFNTTAVTDATPAAAVDVDLPAQPLASALNELAHQARLQLMVHPDLGARRQAPAVSGRLTVREALDRLLAGSGLAARIQGSEVIVREAPPATTGRTTTLPAVVVTAAAERSAITEGSGSYASRSVTIGKTAQSLRETPQSVSVLGRQQMDDTGVTTMDEAVNYLTGLSTAGYGQHAAGFAGTTLVARGYDINSQLDGVPLTFGENHDLALYDRIEVLRGPTGLLQGSGEPGGAVNHVLKRPEAAVGLNGLASIGSWHNRRLGADVTGPLNASGSLRGRAILLHSDRNAYYDVGRATARTGYLVLDGDLTPQTTISASAILADRQGINFWGLPQYSDGRVVERRSAFVGLDRESKTTKHQYQLALRHRFDSGWAFQATWLKSKSDYRGFGGYATSDVDRATGLGNISIGRIATINENEAVDLNVSGPLRAWGRTHTLVAGWNRAAHTYVGGSRYTSFTDVDVLGRHDFDIDEAILRRGQTELTKSGLFGTARLKLTDPLTLVLGGRRSDYDSRSRVITDTTTAWTDSVANTQGKFTAFGGLVWDLTHQVSVYASYADTFIPQTQLTAAGRVLDPREGWQLEAGVKGEFFDGALNASLALFRIRDTNRAMLDTTTAGCNAAGGECYRAAGLVQSQGWEMEVVGSPAPGWDIAAGYSYVQARFLEDADPDNVGQRFSAQNTPRHLFKLWTQYRFDAQTLGGRLDGWSVGSGLKIQSDLVSTAVRQGGFATVSAKVGYRFNPKVDAVLLVNNVFDRHYLQQVGTTFFNLYGEARSVMLAVRGGL